MLIGILVEEVEKRGFVHGKDFLDGLSAEVEGVDVLSHGVP